MSKQTKTLSNSMTTRRFNTCTRAIRKGGTKIERLVVEIGIAKAWELKNYDSFKSYSEVELPNWSPDTLYRKKNCGTVLYEVEGFDAVGLYSNHAIEPLHKAKLKPAQLKKVWRRICRKCKPDEPLDGIPEGLPDPKKVTKKAVEDALVALNFVEPKATPKTGRKEITHENERKSLAPKQSTNKSSILTKRKRVTAESFYSAMEDHESTTNYANRIGKAIRDSFNKNDILKLCEFLTRQL